MSQTETPPRLDLPTDPAVRAQRDVPAWVFGMVILLCMAGGGAFVWWFFASPPSTRVVTLKEQGPGVVAERDVSARRPGRRGSVAPNPLPQGALPSFTRVTKKWDGVPLEQVVRELPLPERMKLVIAADEARQRPITLDVQDQPLWSVIDALCAQAQVEPAKSGGGSGRSTVSLVSPPGPKARPTAVHGPFMVSLRSMSYSGRVELARPDRVERLVSLDFVLAAEPGHRVYAVVPHATIEVAADQAGRSLLSPAPTYSGPRRLDDGWRATASGRINYVDGAQRLARLRGYLSVLVCDRIEAFEIDNPLEDAERSTTIDGVEVRFVRLRERGQYSAEFEAAGGDSPLHLRFIIDEHTIQLLDQDGKAFTTDGGGWGGGRSDRFRFHRDFRKAARRNPAKLILHAPVGLKEVRVPFEFTDLPLPG